MLERMRIGAHQLNKKLDVSITNLKTKFYKQMLTSWLSLYNQTPEHIIEILTIPPELSI